MLTLYSFFIHLYGFAIKIAGLFGNKRAKEWRLGQKSIQQIFPKKSTWIHCASLGEYEQALPLIEKIQLEKPNKPIVVTFFSPSGYKIINKKNTVDVVSYLPLDTKNNAENFIQKLNPEIAIFVKYEFWFNYLITLKNRKVKTYFISVSLRKEHFLFKNYASSFREILQKTEGISVQNNSTKELLQKYGFQNVFLSGDTRFDRVYTIAKQAKKNTIVEQFKGNNPLLVAGSSWQIEERILADFTAKNKCKLVIAPHDISLKHLDEIEKLFKNNIVRYSAYKNQNVTVLLIDNIGLLSSIYKYADIAFVGGGFKNALHNILEPATYGIPVIYGNNHIKFPEAQALEVNGGGKSVANTVQFQKHTASLLQNKEFRTNTGRKSKNFIEEQTGATSKIMTFIYK